MFFSSDESNPCGVFNLGHLLAVVICIVFIALLIIITRKQKKETTERNIKIIAIFVFLLEIVKIVFNIVTNRAGELDNVLPLYFCSLFIYALIAASFFKGKIKEAGYTFLYYGGFIGGCAFLLYPSTSLLLFPLWHFLTLHSMIYHSLMIYVSLIIVIKGLFVPERKYFYSYFLFTTLFCLIALSINIIFPGNNLMFVSRPMENTFLVYIGKIAGVLYPAVIIICQNGGSFITAQLGYELFKKIKSKKEKSQ